MSAYTPYLLMYLGFSSSGVCFNLLLDTSLNVFPSSRLNLPDADLSAEVYPAEFLFGLLETCLMSDCFNFLTDLEGLFLPGVYFSTLGFFFLPLRSGYFAFTCPGEARV